MQSYSILTAQEEKCSLIKGLKLSKKNSTNDQMSSRERILAALQAQPVDRIPFVPLIDTYTVLDMPAHIQQAMQVCSFT